MDFLGAFLVLDPSGGVGLMERTLIVQAVLLMLVVVIPVYVLVFFFAWYYRARNTKAKYLPDWEHAKVDELIWWAIPFEIVLVLGALTWTSTHELDPRRPLVSENPPLVVQVIALDWKWLFIYPEEEIATVGYLRLPVGEPVRFEVTADAPMNSFWIPALGGQIYAMTGMVNELNLIADKEGVYTGGSANYSGDGFAHMKFLVEVVPRYEFDAWVGEIGSSPNTLTSESYEALIKPSSGDRISYGMVEENLYNKIVGKFQFQGGYTH